PESCHGRAGLRPNRKANRDDETAAGCRLRKFDVTGQEFDDAPDNRKTQATAAGRTARYAVEALEGAPALLARNPRSIIADREHHGSVAGRHVECDATPLTHVSNGVLQQI